MLEVETAFKNAGGITEGERQMLMKEFSEAEHIKAESLTKIKMFVKTDAIFLSFEISLEKFQNSSRLRKREKSMTMFRKN